MRGKVPYKGKFVKVDNIQTGEPIMLSAEEWKQRTKRITRQNLRLYLVIFPLVIFPLWLGMSLVFGNRWWPDAVISATIYCVGFPLAMIGRMYYNSRKGYSKDDYTGLFEHGLVVKVPELPEGTFIPYRLIRDFRVKDGRFNKSLTLDILGFKKPSPVFGIKILQDDGLEMLRRMILRRPEEQEPPELHIYGGRSARIVSIPSRSDETEKGTRVS